MSNLPRVLIVSGAPLNDTDGDSSTLCNMFWDYDPDKVAQVYFQTTTPNSRCCKKYFLISEISLLRKLFVWNTVVGQEVNMGDVSSQPTETQINSEMKLGAFVRSHRSKVFVYMRELLWGFGFWKNKNLRRFIEDFRPDIIWCESYPNRYIHNIGMYVTRVSKKPSVLFIQDEIYQISPYMSFGDKLYRMFIRGVIKDHIRQCKGHFVASPLMKEKYDNIFGINSIFIAKSFNCEKLPPVSHSVHTPIRLVYLGNVVYGRLATLIEIAKALRIINSDSISIEFSIYTTQYISDGNKKFLLDTPGVKLPSPVPYDVVPNVISENDVLLFVESFEVERKYEAALSFSTKLADYLQSGRCIMALGPSDIAPISYLYNNDAALCVTDVDRIHDFLSENLNEKIILEYAQKGRDCFIRNHNRSVMDKRIYEEITRIAGVLK